MHFVTLSAVLALCLGRSFASPTLGGLAPRATPTVYLCGDSTMAKGGAGDGSTDGWGQYLGAYTTVTVVNKAIGGRSARSYWDEGRFSTVAGLVKAGDIVVIEFGHNDGGSPTSADNGRSDCPGDGEQTCKSSSTGATVYTFVHYVIAAAKLMTAKGVTVILSSQTPNNEWEGGVYGAAPSRFVGYDITAKNNLASSSVTFVDHFQAVSKSKFRLSLFLHSSSHILDLRLIITDLNYIVYAKLGSSATNALYPKDHTHTSPTGAKLSAEAFTQAIYQAMNGTTSLKPYIIARPPIVY